MGTSETDGRTFPVVHSILSTGALMSQVLPSYDVGAPTACHFLNLGLNDTYLVRTVSSRYVLRVYRHGWRSLDDIRYELDLLQHVQAKGVSVAVPIPRQVWLMGLHAGIGYYLGSGWLSDWYFDRALKFLREWEVEHLK